MRNFDQSSRTEDSPVENIVEDTIGRDQIEKAIDEGNVVDGVVAQAPENTAATTTTSSMYSSSRSTTTVVKTSTTVLATPTTSAEAPTTTTFDTTSGGGVAQSRSLPLLILVIGAVSAMWFS
jgi:hypothetical protein